MRQLIILAFLLFSFISQAQSLNFEATGTAPDWFANDLNETTHTLYNDYLENGKIVVLEFMNVNCGACQTYAPYVGEFYETYGPNGTGEVEVIALDINAGSTDSQCNSYVEEYGAAYPLINGNSTSYYGAEIVYTPTFYIIFPDGTYTNRCTSYCEASTSPSNLSNDLGGIVNQWMAMSMGSNPWGDAPDTDCNATILIQPTTEIILDGSAVSSGSWIGTFYTDAAGNMAFGGGVQWNGETTSIAAWGSEAGMNNGFAAGEEFTFGIIDPDSGETIYSTQATYSFGSSTYGCNGLSGISSLAFTSQSDDSDCADDNSGALDCSTQIMVFGCDGTNSMTGLLVSESCPESCDSCPTDCADNDSSMTPLDCATVITIFGCDGSWNGLTISEECQISCDSCGDDTELVLGCTNELADNYNPSATEDDGSCIVSGCMCDLAMNYDETATSDDGSCLVLSG
ncbi:MAG: hypothetical protein CMP50_06855, partial [Flavobacteriales bacterium]|nr:hypothetical protein [Flavobacteriales bacterium]